MANEISKLKGDHCYVGLPSNSLFTQLGRWYAVATNLIILAGATCTGYYTSMVLQYTRLGPYNHFSKWQWILIWIKIQWPVLHYPNRKQMCFFLYFCGFFSVLLKFVPKGSKYQQPYFGSDNGLAPNRLQVIIWTNDVLHIPYIWVTKPRLVKSWMLYNKITC